MTNKFLALELREEARSIRFKMEFPNYQELYGDFVEWHKMRLKEIQDLLEKMD